MMNRRKLLKMLVGSAGFGSATARAQQRRVWLIGFLALPTRPDRLEASRFGAFVRGMRELGYIEGLLEFAG
jgi:hypothetical protein